MRDPRCPRRQSLPERLLGGTAVLQRPRERKVWALWIALLVGVAVLGWMAWRLARQIQAPPESTPATDASQS
jgi:threonine/homoserine/homoserine lactone efflux protein